MPVVVTGESAYDKEMARWDTPRSQGGMKPDGYEPFPKMLYRARQNAQQKWIVSDVAEMYAVDPVVQAQAAAFNASCQRTVRDQSELDRAWGEGWRNSAQAALDLVEQQRQELAQAAAEANYSAARMSPQAQAERDALQAVTETHVVDVPAPKRKPGRKPKAQPAVS